MDGLPPIGWLPWLPPMVWPMAPAPAGASEGDGGSEAVMRRPRRGQRVVRLGLQLTQLALQVGLQAGPVLTLEAAQILDLALQRRAGRLQRAHRHAVLLLRVPLQGVRLGTRVALQALGAAACLADDLVGLGTGLRDRLVGGLLREREDTGGAVATGALTGLLHLRLLHLLHLLLRGVTTHGAAHRAAHGTALHRAGAVRALRTGAVLALGTRTVTTGTGGQLRSTTGQLGGPICGGCCWTGGPDMAAGTGAPGRSCGSGLRMPCCWFCAAARVAAASFARRSSFSRSRRVSSDSTSSRKASTSSSS